MRRIVAVVVIVLLILIAAGGAVWVKDSDSQTAVDLRDRLDIKKSESQGITGSGYIDAQQITLASEVGGEVASVAVKAGDPVLAGDAVVQVKSADLDTQLQQAQATVDTARAQFERLSADSQVQSAQLPGAAGTAPAQQRLAEALVHQAEARLHTLEVQQRKLAIYAPIDGTVDEVLTQPGEQVQPGTPLVRVSQPNPVQLTVYVPQTQLGDVRPGQTAKVTVDAFPDQEFTGQVVAIANQAEFTPKNVQTKDQRADLVFAVRIELPNEDGALKAGMPADAVIEEG
jgi:HlyD family secretion protein